MKERRCLLFLLLTACAALVLISCASEQPETWDLEAETTSALKEEFAGELAYLEEAWGQPIDQIDQASFSQFADAVNRAILDPALTEGCRFGALMDAIALAKARSAHAEVYRSYGPVTGEFLGSAAVGTTIAEIPEKSFTVEEDCLPGITLTGNRNWSARASLDGPERGALLDNGMRAMDAASCLLQSCGRPPPRERSTILPIQTLRPLPAAQRSPPRGRCLWTRVCRRMGEVATGREEITLSRRFGLTRSSI